MRNMIKTMLIAVSMTVVHTVAQAAPVVIVPRAAVSVPVVRSTPVAPVARVSPPPTRVSVSRGSQPENTINTMVPIMTTMAVVGAVTSSNSASASEATPVKVATPLLTVCSVDELKKAQLWQEDCKNIDSEFVTVSYCPILSYFRFCKEASVEDVQGLKPVKEGYRHIFLKE